MVRNAGKGATADTAAGGGRAGANAHPEAARAPWPIPIPTARAFGLAAGSLVLLALWPPLGVAALLALTLAAALDGRGARRFGMPAGAIQLPSRVGQDAPLNVRVEWVAPAGREVVGHFTLEVESALATDEATGLEPLALAPGERFAFTLPLSSAHRGRRSVLALWVTVRGAWGLAFARARLPVAAETLIVPGLREAQRLRLDMEHGRRRDPGRHAVRQRDDAGSFDSLREYQRGDDPRRMDWKASARHLSPVVRVMRAERRQDMVLCLDLGRAMAEPHQERERLDQALAAALCLTAAAEGFRDRVGLFAFREAPVRLLSPAERRFGQVALELARLEAGRVEPDYRGALLELSRRLARRSLVVVFSDAIDAEVSEPLVSGLALLARRHLTLFVALESPALAAARDGALERPEDAYRLAALAELGRARRATLVALRRRGVEVVDAPPGAGAALAVDRYLALKRRGAL